MRGLIGNNEVFKSLKSGLMRTNALRMPPQKNVFEPRFYALIPKDPYEANVVLHLKGDGADGSTTIVDSSPKNKTTTRNGNLVISTAQSVYGGSSMYFDGSNDYVYIPYDSDFNLPGQFTIEFWVYRLDNGSYRTIYELGYYYNGILFRPHSSSSGEVYINGSVLINNYTDEIGLNNWKHVALTRDSSNNLRLWIGGVLYASVSNSSNINTVSVHTHIGMSTHTTGQSHYGYIDSFRITKGVCRYTANFDPMDDFATYLNYVVV